MAIGKEENLNSKNLSFYNITSRFTEIKPKVITDHIMISESDYIILR